MLSNAIVLTNASFQADTKQFLGFDCEFHGQMSKDFFAIPVDDQIDGVFRRKPALSTIEELIFADP
jgi:hypothetical protein